MAKRKKYGGGSRKGVPNKSTAEVREAIALFVEGNIERLNGWLDDIAKDNPAGAFDRFMSVVEYHIPKLARQELTGKDGEDPIRFSDVSVKDRILKAIPDDQLEKLLAEYNG